MPTPGEEIAVAVRRTLAEEAQRNEYHVSIVRVFAYTLITVLDVLLYLAHVRPLGNIVASTLLIAIAGALVWAVHRHFRPWFRFAIPVLDAIFITELVLTRMETMGASPALMATAALSCGLFAATGAIRFDRVASGWTTVLALLVLWVTVGVRTKPSGMLYAVCALLALGFLNVWLSERVRRSMESVRSRVLLNRFLQPSIVEQAFSNPEALVTAPRTVEATILVSDVRGFTALAEKLAPAEVLELLNRVQGELAAAVQRNGGGVDKFIGDGMLAVFGTPEPDPRHAEHAIAAARDILQAIDRMNAKNPGSDPVRIGLGIHSGPVVAGVLGNAERLEFTVIGDTVNVASRLESLTKELNAPVVISVETANRAPMVRLKSLGEVPLRGRSQRVRVFTLEPRAISGTLPAAVGQADG